MYYTDNPIADFMRYDAEQQRKISLLPVCSVCKHHIQDDWCYKIEGNFFCCDCLNKLYRRNTEDYVESEVEGE